MNIEQLTNEDSNILNENSEILAEIKSKVIKSFYVFDDYGGVELWYLGKNTDENDKVELEKRMRPYLKLVGCSDMLGVVINPHLEGEGLGKDPAHWIAIRECLRIDPYYKWVVVK